MTTGPIVNEHGDESHPAFGLIGAYRGTSTPGAVLFDSDIQHNHTIRIHIRTATRKRSLHHDWIHGNKELVEVELSEAQWASFVSSMNSGDGVPCTLRRVENVRVAELPYDPRLAYSMEETRRAAQAAFEGIQAAMAAYDAMGSNATAKERREALGQLRATINNAVPNVDFAGKTLVGHAENVVTKARADIEAFVVAKAQQLGLSPGDVANHPLALPVGEDER